MNSAERLETLRRLRRWLDEAFRVPGTAGDWLFVSSIMAGVIAVALVPLFVMYWLVHVLAANLPAVAR